MSHRLINLSPDLSRLRNDGYDVDVKSGCLLVKDVPYVDSDKQIRRGTIVSVLTMAGDVTAKPDDHVAYFIGDYPCREDGSEIDQIRHASGKFPLGEGVEADHKFSAKPKPSDYYDDYHAKMTTYVTILSGHAQAIDPLVTAKTFPVVQPGDDEESPFNYVDTASARAEINLVTAKLASGKVAIVGLGGTGSYVLDLVAKTPVSEIHLFDGDAFLQHNAFRFPGAPSADELRTKPTKAAYLRAIYSKMHRGIFAHECYVDASNVGLLHGIDFVFLCLDRPSAKQPIIEKLEQLMLPFIDVGMGLYVADGSLAGIVRVTTSTPAKREHVRTSNRISLADSDHANEYEHNIQVADLNALNASLAVIRWKKLLGFYNDFEKEHHSTYTIDGNTLLNEDQA